MGGEPLKNPGIGHTDLLRRRAAQQSALSRLGLVALGGGSLRSLLEEATCLVAETLDCELSQAFELDPGAGCLRLRAAVGHQDELIDAATVETGRGSLAGFTVARDQPVVVEDLRTDARFRPPELLLDHGAVSGLTVVIHSSDHVHGTVPWGVLGVHTRLPRTFSEEDIDFLHTVANTLGLAIERNEAERELRQRHAEIAQLVEQVAKLADDRRRILADALDAEDRTREQISQLLHDEVLQSLLTARQDLAAFRPGAAGEEAISQAREAIVSAIRELRNAVVALHPVTLEQGGLASAIKAIADLHASRGGFEISLEVERWTSGPRNQLIVSLAQELLSNVARHAAADHVTISIRRRDDTIVVEVADDGRGMSRARPGQALEDGHVGLASIAMRLESVGGSIEIDSRPAHGTHIRSVIPADAPSDRADHQPASRPRIPGDSDD